jgi:hypothetical protein
MSQFYQIYISPKPDTKSEDVQKVMDLAIDWFKYDDKNWILYTISDARKWYSRLEKFVNPGGYILISKVDTTDYFGFMNPNLWAWFTKWLAKER